MLRYAVFSANSSFGITFGANINIFMAVILHYFWNFVDSTKEMGTNYVFLPLAAGNKALKDSNLKLILS